MNAKCSVLNNPGVRRAVRQTRERVKHRKLLRHEYSSADKRESNRAHGLISQRIWQVVAPSEAVYGHSTRIARLVASVLASMKGTELDGQLSDPGQLDIAVD